MKWLAALAALALARPAWTRGLKMPREPEANAVWSKELEAQNEALRKRNRDLESMMQMARAEVQRMDAAASAQKRRRDSCGDGDTDVLKQEIEDLRNKLRAADADKNDLVQSLRRMLAKNSTQMFQKQAERAEQQAERTQQMKMALEVKCGKERQALEAQLQATKGKCDETKELARNLQDENADLQKKLQDSQAELAKTGKVNKELSSDKTNLVSTMQGLMRENSRFKHTLQKETDMEKKEAAELAVDKALLAKLKKAPTSAAKKQVKAMLKALPRRHEQLSDAQRAHMKEMDRYIDSATAASDDSADDVSEQQLRAVRRQEDLIARGKVGTHLSDWLGLKAPLPKPVAGAAPESSSSLAKAPANQKAEVDDGGEAEAEALVTQAKAQLAAMERADAGS